MIRFKLIESSFFEGYFHVPNNERIIISRDGRIIDLRSMYSFIVLSLDTAYYEYPVINVMGQGTLHVHFLLAETFIPKPPNKGNLTVNHKDGDKLNYSLDNLEWVSRSDNLLHAYGAGLRTDGKAVLIRNINTKEVKRYSTTADAARHLNVLPDVIRNFIKSKVPYPFDGIYEMVNENDNWRDIETTNIIRMEPMDPSVVCLADRKYMVFDSAESAGRYLNVSENTILKQIYNDNETSYKGMKFFKRSEIVDRLTDSVYIPGSFKDIKPSTKIKPIVVTDRTTGHVTEWENITAFARVVGVNRSTIRKSMTINDGYWNQYLITYKDKSGSVERPS